MNFGACANLYVLFCAAVGPKHYGIHYGRLRLVWLAKLLPSRPAETTELATEHRGPTGKSHSGCGEEHHLLFQNLVIAKLSHPMRREPCSFYGAQQYTYAAICVCKYIYIYAYIHTYTYVCAYVYANTGVYMYSYCL